MCNPLSVPDTSANTNNFATSFRAAVASALVVVIGTQPVWAWGRDGHKMINRLAVQYLAADVPAFLHTPVALDTIEYLGPEPDRWKQRDAEPELVATQSPDHFFDLEYANLAGIPCATGSTGCDAWAVTFPTKRYDFMRALAAAQARNPGLPLDERVGFAPWQVEEVWQRLKTDFREYRKLIAASQPTGPDETAILFDIGWLGHYVGDGSQPLHNTIQYNGWTGSNPHGYTVAHGIHAKFESIYVTANVKRDVDVAPLVATSQPRVIDDEWNQYLDYVFHSNSLVEKIYQLDKAGAFDGAGTPEGKTLADERLAAGAIELRDLIYSAWVHSADPVQEYQGPA